ncbi:hypothetical protein [Stenotrophomonas sp. NY11291]|uniref:hypothetical protein n=1 Tax=Stenotrophomonas sp. NY11291 TaxID=2939415 RepID=UPI00130FBE66|nr:hypothetical protein [Stenotrophomonas sp. NY11291]UQA21812.1 hypothetical protein M1L61_18860 [Stenotrophomonas sp. NY11291]
MRFDARLYLRTESADQPGVTLQFRPVSQPNMPQINLTVDTADAAALKVGAVYRFEATEIPQEG